VAENCVKGARAGLGAGGRRLIIEAARITAKITALDSIRRTLGLPGESKRFPPVPCASC